jgi:4,5-dihydroxyphthalate decarboxylase
LIVTVAAGPYAHLRELADGRGVDGIEVRREVLEPGRIFPRMLREGAWDVAEMSLATAYILAGEGDGRFVPLPVFPSRTFRHSSLYVAADSRLSGAAGLRGARIGVLRYAMTTAVWVREMLSRQYSVPLESLRWVVGESSPHPASVSVEVVGGAGALEAMAVSGQIDCLVSGRTPAAVRTGRLRRLIPDFLAEEKAYFNATGAFPIMHVMVAKRELLEARADVARRLLSRFEEAKKHAEEGLANFDLSIYPLPWMPAYVEDARRAMPAGLWPYGIEPNRSTLTAFANALAAQALVGRFLPPEEVFARV